MIQSHPAQISVSTWHYLIAATLALFVFFHFTAFVLFSIREQGLEGWCHHRRHPAWSGTSDANYSN